MTLPAQMDPKVIKYLTIHCAATPEGRDVKAETISAWDQAKFGQTSYHFVVELDGRYVRTLRDDQRGAHVGGHNTGNIGICYVGGCDNALPRGRRPTCWPNGGKSNELCSGFAVARPSGGGSSRSGARF